MGRMLHPGDRAPCFFTWWNFLQISRSLVPPPRLCLETWQCICWTLRCNTCHKLSRNTFSKHCLVPRPLVFLPWRESLIWGVGYRPVQIRIGDSKVWIVHTGKHWKSKIKFMTKWKKFIVEVSRVVDVLGVVYRGLRRDATSPCTN